MKLLVGLLIVLVAVLFYLVLRQPTGQQNNLLGDSVSIRQDSGNVQWKLPGGDWQTITTVSTLTGKAGADGKDGSDGKDGNDGQNGQNGQDGRDGTNGRDGAQGTTGATGVQGDQGTQGIQGVAGQDGIDGVDGRDGADGAQGIQGVQGAQGEQGIQGITGANGTDGTDGREIELQKDLYYIQWRYVGEPGWRNLIAYSDLKGEKGDTGATGPANSLSIGTVNRTACNPTVTITGAAPNQTLNLGIPGLPTGGTAGQVLTKNSNTDCDAVWATQNVIVGAGRPDVLGTMDAATQAKVATASSGTEFRSTDGPQGAWVWMKQGSEWVVTSGDTGWRDIASLLQNGWQVGIGGRVHLKRVDTTVLMNVVLRNDTATGQQAFSLPSGFRGQASTSAAFTHGGNLYTGTYFSGGTSLQMVGLYPTPTSYNASMFQTVFNTAQNWPTALPGTAV